MPPRPALRLGFVAPRFGVALTGGAELHARLLAQHLAAGGHTVDVFTTCSVDHSTWRNTLPAGSERDGDLTVRRFPVDERDLGIHGELERAIHAGFPLSYDEELLWLRHGAASTAMEDALHAEAHGYDLVLGIQYTWGVTHFSLRRCAGRAVLIPTLHDEPYAQLRVVRELLSTVHGVMFSTQAERAVAERLGADIERSAIVAVGFERERVGDGEAFRRRHAITGPTLLYAGRFESGKNVPLLYDYFGRYHERRGSGVRLVMYGSGAEAPPRHPAITHVAPDWDREKEDMYASATVFVAPGVNESLSIVLPQAWLQERPGVVHAHCGPTRELCERSNGGLWFSSYAEFEEVLDRLFASAALREALGRNGRAFVEREYSWDAVLGRFHDAAYAWLPAVPTSV